MNRPLKTRLLALVPAAALLFAFLFARPAASAGSFPDLTRHWAAAAMERWIAYGVVEGYAGAAMPDRPLTRGELAALLTRVMDYQTQAENTFSDLGQDWYTDDVLLTAAAGVLRGGGDGAMRPEAAMTREEAAVVLCRALGLAERPEAPPFTDAGSLSDWAKGSVAALADAGIAQGTPAGGFEGKRAITRAEFITLLGRAIAALYREAGQYEDGTLAGSCVVSTGGVVLSNMTVQGGVILAEGLGEGSMTLDHVAVTGDCIVRGDGATLRVSGGTLAAVSLSAEHSTVIVEQGAAVGQMTVFGTAHIVNNGSIQTLSAHTPDITMDGAGPEHVEVAEGVQPPALPPPPDDPEPPLPPAGDTTPPAAADRTVAASDLLPDSVTLRWIQATDNQTAQSALKYTVYCSTADNLTTAAACAANGTPLNSGGTAGIARLDATGLSPYTQYWFNVVVSDGAGNKTAYTPVAVKTALPVTNSAELTSALDGGAADGDTVFVALGTYDVTRAARNGVIERAITLIGAVGQNGELPVLQASMDGPWRRQSIVLVAAPNVTLRNLEFRRADGSYNKIVEVAADNVTIDGCIIGDNMGVPGLYFNGAGENTGSDITRFTVVSSLLRSALDITNGTGIGGVSGDMLVTGNTFDGAWVQFEGGGIAAWLTHENGTYPTVTDNFFVNLAATERSGWRQFVAASYFLKDTGGGQEGKAPDPVYLNDILVHNDIAWTDSGTVLQLVRADRGAYYGEFACIGDNQAGIIRTHLVMP